MHIASRDEIILFQERGFAILKNAIPKDLLSYFKATLERLVDIFFEKHLEHSNNKKPTLSCDEKIIALKNKNPDYVSIIQRIISRTPEFFSLSSCIDTMPLMRVIYGLDDKSPVYIINNGVVFTCPNDSHNKAISNFETGWHNDVFYTIPQSRFWQVWVPLLHHATTEIGTLIVCPGSHKDGIGKQGIDIAADYNNRYFINPDSLSKYAPESIEVELGDIFIFDSRLIHKSGVNTSNNVRCSMLGAYHDALSNNFLPISFEYKYYTKTPEGYFYEIFGDENARKIMFDDIASVDLSFKNGV